MERSNEAAAPGLRAGVLIGGASRRMGTPKALLEIDGETLLERTARILSARAEGVVLLGDGPVPPGLDLPRLPDPAGLAGPLAGILAALRSAPGAAWIVTACDQPGLSLEAVDWLLAQRTADAWAVLPRVDERGVEPLLALYEPRALELAEALVAGGRLSPSRLARDPKCATPRVPARLAAAWADVDTPDDWERWHPTRRC